MTRRRRRRIQKSAGAAADRVERHFRQLLRTAQAKANRVIVARQPAACSAICLGMASALPFK